MIVILQPHTDRARIDEVIAEVARLGYEPRPIIGDVQTVVAAIGDETTHGSLESLDALPQVQQVMRVQKRWKLVARDSRPDGTTVDVDGVPVGPGAPLALMAGPCSVESEEQLLTTARRGEGRRGDDPARRRVQAAHQPLRVPGVRQGRVAAVVVGQEGNGPADRHRTALRARRRQLVAEHADLLQIGARNAQNFRLLVAAARTGKPILLKRGLSQRIEEWLLGAEYILSEGNGGVILCERGIRTFETYTRNTLDLGAVAIVKRETHLPVVVDPSQGAGRADLVASFCAGAVAMGADGLLIEVHPNPAEALSDGQQQVDFAAFGKLVDGLQPFLHAVGRPVA